MNDRSSHHSRLLLATLLIEAFVLLHFLGVFPFLGPAMSIGLFVLAGVAFQRVRRAEEAIHPPASLTPVQLEFLSPRKVSMLVVAAGVLGLAMSFLVRIVMS
jgi:Na+-translocating ferredoxin:NAD+ oxidoreductase RnfA subunit